MKGGGTVWCFIHYSCHVTWIMWRLNRRGVGYLGLSQAVWKGFFISLSVYFAPTLSQTYTHPFLSLSCPTLIPILWHSIISPNPCFFLLVHPSIYTLPFLYLAFFPPLYFPLFCSDIKQLTTCLVAGLQCAGRRVLLSFCIYRYFVSRSLSDCFHYVSFCDLRICLKLGYVIQRSFIGISSVLELIL